MLYSNDIEEKHYWKVFLLTWLTCDLLGCEAGRAAGTGECGTAASPLTAAELRGHKLCKTPKTFLLLHQEKTIWAKEPFW